VDNVLACCGCHSPYLTLRADPVNKRYHSSCCYISRSASRQFIAFKYEQLLLSFRRDCVHFGFVAHAPRRKPFATLIGNSTPRKGPWPCTQSAQINLYHHHPIQIRKPPDPQVLLIAYSTQTPYLSSTPEKNPITSLTFLHSALAAAGLGVEENSDIPGMRYQTYSESPILSNLTLKLDIAKGSASCSIAVGEGAEVGEVGEMGDSDTTYCVSIFTTLS
jgi:hypothetical protein